MAYCPLTETNGSRKSWILFLLFFACDFFLLSFHFHGSKSKSEHSVSFSVSAKMKFDENRRFLLLPATVWPVCFSNWIKLLPRIENNIKKRSHTHTHFSGDQKTHFTLCLYSVLETVTQKKVITNSGRPNDNQANAKKSQPKNRHCSQKHYLKSFSSLKIK